MYHALDESFASRKLTFTKAHPHESSPSRKLPLGKESRIYLRHFEQYMANQNHVGELPGHLP